MEGEGGRENGKKKLGGGEGKERGRRREKGRPAGGRYFPQTLSSCRRLFLPLRSFLSNLEDFN